MIDIGVQNSGYQRAVDDDHEIIDALWVTKLCTNIGLMHRTDYIENTIHQTSTPVYVRSFLLWVFMVWF